MRLQMLSVATGSWLIRAMEATAAASQRCLRRETEEVAPASNLVDETGASAQLGDGGAGGPSVSVQGEGASGTAASGVCDGLLALSIIARIAAVAVAFVASAAVTARLVEEVSRRTCNAAYVLWVVGASLGHVAAFL